MRIPSKVISRKRFWDEHARSFTVELILPLRSTGPSLQKSTGAWILFMVGWWTAFIGRRFREPVRTLNAYLLYPISDSVLPASVVKLSANKGYYYAGEVAGDWQSLKNSMGICEPEIENVSMWFNHAGHDLNGGIPNWLHGQIPSLAVVFSEEVARLPQIEVSFSCKDAQASPTIAATIPDDTIIDVERSTIEQPQSAVLPDLHRVDLESPSEGFCATTNSGTEPNGDLLDVASVQEPDALAGILPVAERTDATELETRTAVEHSISPATLQIEINDSLDDSPESLESKLTTIVRSIEPTDLGEDIAGAELESEDETSTHLIAPKASPPDFRSASSVTSSLGAKIEITARPEMPSVERVDPDRHHANAQPGTLRAWNATPKPRWCRAAGRRGRAQCSTCRWFSTARFARVAS